LTASEGPVSRKSLLTVVTTASEGPVSRKNLLTADWTASDQPDRFDDFKAAIGMTSFPGSGHLLPRINILHFSVE